MIYKKRYYFFLIVFSILFTQCGHTSHLNKQNESKGLKDYYKNYFPIGVAVTPRDLSGYEAKMILEEFNSLTPENAMKMGQFIQGKIFTTGKMQTVL